MQHDDVFKKMHTARVKEGIQPGYLFLPRVFVLYIIRVLCIILMYLSYGGVKLLNVTKTSGISSHFSD